MNSLNRWSSLQGLVLGFSLWASMVVAAGAPEVLKIRGDHLGTATEVSLDGVKLPFKVVDEGTLLITLSTVPNEKSQLVVTTPGGQVTQSWSMPRPQSKETLPMKIVEVSPRSGPEAGGGTLVILGQGFREKSKDLKVMVGGSPASSLSVSSDERLTITLPPHPAGRVALVIEKDEQSASLDNAYEYRAAPVIQQIEPASGSVAGGSRVQIRGSGFAIDAPLEVRFGKAPAQMILNRSADSLEVLTPAYTEGPVDLVLINPDGQEGSLKAAYRYLPTPTIRTLEIDRP